MGVSQMHLSKVGHFRWVLQIKPSVRISATTQMRKCRDIAVCASSSDSSTFLRALIFSHLLHNLAQVRDGNTQQVLSGNIYTVYRNISKVKLTLFITLYLLFHTFFTCICFDFFHNSFIFTWFLHGSFSHVRFLHSSFIFRCFFVTIR